MRKPTLRDVARMAGVSYATADRVLNARGGVAEKSIRRVQQAIQDMGYERDQQAANLSRRRTYDFRFLLPQGDHSFFQVLRGAIEAERAPRQSERIRISVHELPALEPEPLAQALESLQPGDCDCIALVGIETPRVAAAVRRLSQAGQPIVTLVADAAADARAAYVGIDNIVAGRTAGRLIRLAHQDRPGQILPIIGAYTARDHSDRLEGARAVLAEPGGNFSLLPDLVVQDRPEVMREALARALVANPGITGIYSIGAGNRALVAHLAQLGAARPFVVLHDLTPVTRAAVERGLIDAIIDQRPGSEVARTLDLMKALADGRDIDASAGLITPAIYLRDNLPRPGDDCRCAEQEHA